MPDYKSQYKKKWEAESDGAGNRIGLWCKKKSDYVAKCTPCDKDIPIAGKGKTTLTLHGQRKSHLKKLEKMLSVESQPNTSFEDNQPSTSSANNENNSSDVSLQDQDQFLDEQTRSSEAIWSAMVADHDLSFHISDHFTKNVYKMFPDSAIAAGFKCSCTKTSYLICDGMAVDVQTKLLNKIRDIPFSLLVDESNKQYGKKFLCAMVKFYDHDLNKITVRFLDLFICNDGTADDITKNIVDMLDRNNLSFENLIQIMTDNPNVMRGKYSGVVNQITSKHANHLIDIGGCSLHIISNAVSNSLPKLIRFENIEDFMQDTSSFFSYHVQFAEKFTNIQDIFDLEKHKLLKYTEIRFLSVYPVVERLTKQYEAVKALFMDYIPKHHPKVEQQKRVIRIKETLNHHFTLPTLHFISFVLQSFQKYEKLFQRDEPTLHLLYDQQIDLFRGTLLHFCDFSKIKALKNSKELLKFDFKNEINIKALEEISVGVATKELLSNFSQQVKTLFLGGVKSFFWKYSRKW